MALVADIPRAVQTGLQIRQQEQLRPIQQQTAQLGLERQQQALRLGGLQQESLQQQIDQRTDEQKNVDFVTSALRIKSLPDNQKLQALVSNRDRIVAAGGDPSETNAGIQLAQQGNFAELNSNLDNIEQIGIQQGIIKAPIDKSFTLSKDQQRFDDSGKLIAGGILSKATTAEIPPILLEGLSVDLAAKGAAAYTAAGGGKDGLASFQKVIDKGSEQERRLTSPKLIQSSFPQASAAEIVQLQAAMDAARTTETGLKAAGKIREEQRRLVKVQGFQDRSIVLLDKVLASDELGDVLGSIEGTIDFRLQDSEAELIADIEEVGDILTADNLKLMTGVLSESDIKILRNLAGGGLKRTRTEERFRADVQAIRDEMAAKRVLTVDEQSSKSQSQDQSSGTFAINQQTGQRLQLVNGEWVEVE